MVVKTFNMEEVLFQKFNNKLASIDTLLVFCSENDCSDLYIKAGTKPHINRYGRMYEVPCMPINDIAWNDFSKIAISAERNSKYVREKMLDIAYTVDIPEDSKHRKNHKTFRYRVSAGFSQRRFIATFRMINPDLPSFSTIKFPEIVRDALESSFETKTGIILLCGPTGSGKTTTLASSINDFSKDDGPLQNSMIITLEDPIEYVYDMTKNTRIIQKELGVDFKSFSSGVKQSLREHPTHILCGEIRDREGINVCVEASRTGHKVITTFHTDDVPGTVSRMFFYLSSGDNTDEAMHDLITHLDFILCQRLVSSGESFRLETQYMLFIDEIKVALKRIVSEGQNIPTAIAQLFNNKSLIDSGVIKDWD